MLITTARPTVFGLAKRAWSSLFRAAASMALLFVIGYGLMAGLDVAVDRLSTLLAIPSHDAVREMVKSGRRLPWLNLAKAFGMDIAICLLRAIITAPLAVAMHRFILLSERRSIYFVSRLSLRFSLWLVGLQVPAVILLWLILFATQDTALVPILFMILAALLLFLMQTLQLFPGVAVEERSRDISARLETALERAEGMFWLTLVALIVTLLPVQLARLIAVRGFGKLAAHLPLIVPLARAAASLMVGLLGASLVSWLYSYGAHRKGAQQAADRPAPSGTPAGSV